MKIAIINDTHIGARRDSELFADQTSRFFEEEFFPELDRQNVETVVHLGDLFDNRRHIHVDSLRKFNRSFIDPMKKSGRKMLIIAGNHDCFHRNTNEVNTLQEILSPHNFVLLIDHSPLYVKDMQMVLVPWITEYNKNAWDMIANYHNEVPTIMGHFELAGFHMFPGSIVSHGDSVARLEKYEFVGSGHYHTKSDKNNVHYFGTQYELTWADHADPKFFHILDTNTQKLTPVPSKQRMFHKLDTTGDLPKESMTGKYVKIRIDENTPEKVANEFIEQIKSQEPFECLIQDDRVLAKTKLNKDEIFSTELTNIEALHEFVKKQSIADDRKEELMRLFESAYNETLHD